MELGDRELGLIHSYLWDGIELCKEDEDEFEGMSVNVEVEEIGGAEGLGIEPQTVILIRLFWPHASNPTKEDISGRYIVSLVEYRAIREPVVIQERFRSIGCNLARQVQKLVRGEEYERI